MAVAAFTHMIAPAQNMTPAATRMSHQKPNICASRLVWPQIVSRPVGPDLIYGKAQGCSGAHKRVVSQLGGNNVPTYPHCDGRVRTRRQGPDAWNRAGEG